jgi:linoleoyl-CoA desaturase
MPGLALNASAEEAGFATDEGGKLSFAGDTGFYSEVKRRVAEYFERTGLPQRDVPRMYVKTAVILLWFAASYLGLVFVATELWQGALLGVSLAFSIAAIGFAIQHDGNHGAYSNHGAVNHAMGLTLDWLGASSFLWRYKHNVAHHTYTNLTGVDEDLELGWFARLAPTQPYHPIHRFQQLYMWLLYGFLAPRWHFIDDFKNVLPGAFKGHVARVPRGWDLVEFAAGKVVFFGWAFAVPALFHPWTAILVCYAWTMLVAGLAMGVIFQLAHCAEEADFPEPLPGSHRVADAWAVHQVQTTVDFAPRNRVLTWWVGGLNFQIEHHLFPRVSHVHFPRIAEIVQAACAEYGVRYFAHPNFTSAIASHFRWLRRMGRAPVAPMHTVNLPQG